jgi:hypothetical protein
MITTFDVFHNDKFATITIASLNIASIVFTLQTSQESKPMPLNYDGSKNMHDISFTCDVFHKDKSASKDSAIANIYFILLT